MATYPDGIVEFRELENLPGIAFDEADKTTVFAEDIQKLDAEVIAIEETIGATPTGPFGSIAEYLSEMSDQIQEQFEAITALSSSVTAAISTIEDIQDAIAPLDYEETTITSIASGYNNGSFINLKRIGKIVHVAAYIIKDSGNFGTSVTIDVPIPTNYRGTSPELQQIAGLRSETVIGRLIITGGTSAPTNTFRFITGSASSGSNYMGFNGIYLID